MLTIGHSTLPLDTFVAILRENGVRTLVDIRSIPKSRHNPQFALEPLSAASAAVGIEYRWQPSLGGLRKPTNPLPGELPLNAGWVNQSFRGYADYMQTAEFAVGIDELLARSTPSQTAILCAEAVPWRCHRSLVADALAVRGIPVEHILYDKHGASQRRAHTMTKFAHSDGTRLWYPAPDSLFQQEPPAPRRG